ncbi:MAG: sugar phosphate isomerase/epimerase [Candidatus Eisenbacteria sp.]|nr:sugar phosphate isomerase/epimerase [Candidatus Eisenbacteria bacterium]
MEKEQALQDVDLETRADQPASSAEDDAEAGDADAAANGAASADLVDDAQAEANDVVTAQEEEAEEEEGHSLVFPLSYPVLLAELRETIPFLLEHGLNVEVNLADTTYNGEISIRELERMAIELRRNKIKVVAHLPHHDLKLASHDKMVQQHSIEAIQEGLEIGKILGARIAVFHSGFSNHVNPNEIDWWVEQCITSLEDLVARAQEEEVIVALRNTWESDEQVLARLFEAIGSSWFRFACDVGHAACFSQFAPEEWIAQFRDRIVNLHFHDNDGVQDLHQTCGAGVVGFDVVYEAVREELTEPVNITLPVSREALVPSIQHLEECGFQFERSHS